MKKIFLLIASTLCIIGLNAQNNGGISTEMLTKIKDGYPNTPANKALRKPLSVTTSTN